jgi:2'-5' RNA ligase
MNPSQPSRIRAFIAVPVSDSVRQAIGDYQKTLRRQGIDLRWVPPENLHFTLKFLGDIDPAIVSPLGVRLSELAARTRAFPLEAAGAGAFPNPRQPRVFWIGLRRGSELLVQLAEEVSLIVRDFPTQADNKPFKPHLTIGRSREREARPLHLPDPLLHFAFGECPCDRLLLIQSQLGPGGAKYSTLAEAKLAGN